MYNGVRYDLEIAKTIGEVIAKSIKKQIGESEKDEDKDLSGYLKKI